MAPSAPSDLPAAAAEPVPVPTGAGDLATDPAFDAVARLAAAGCRATGATLMVDDGQRLRALAGAPAAAPAGVASRLCAAAIAARATLRVDDLSADPRFAPHLAADEPAPRSGLAAPVVVDDRLVCAIAAWHDQPRRFDTAAEAALADALRIAAALFAARTARDDAAGNEADARSRALAEERWRFALDVSSQGVWDWDLSHDRMYVSSGWCSLLGLDETERPASGEAWARLIHPDDLSPARARLHAHLRGETESYSGEYRMRHRDGRWLWMHNRGKVVDRDPGGRARRVIGTLVDTTERRAAEMARRDKQAAEMASQAKSRLLSRMSHEMRTPLNAVIGFSQLLHDDGVSRDPPRVREYAGHALRAGRSLLELVDDVLELQRLDDSRDAAASLVDVPLRPLVLQALEAAQPLAEASGVHLQCDVPDGLSASADAQGLLQVIRNLSSNAIKYNRPTGRATWSAHRRDDAVALVIQDTGSGMSEAQMSRLFQPFERLGRESGPVEGTGLGLMIARSSVERMGGRLRVSSEPGVGTRVTVELAPGRPAAAEEQAVEAGSASLRLLYVEDNRVNALLFSEALRTLGNIELRVAEDGAEALEAVSGWRPDVLVLDSHLPGMNGYEVLRRLRDVPGLESTPAFMCSADAMADDLRRARSAGFAGYWTKPIDVARVIAELQQVAASAR